MLRQIGDIGDMSCRVSDMCIIVVVVIVVELLLLVVVQDLVLTVLTFVLLSWIASMPQTMMLSSQAWLMVLPVAGEG